MTALLGPPRCARCARIAPGFGRLRGAGRGVDARGAPSGSRRRRFSRLRPDRGRRPCNSGARRVDGRPRSPAPAGPVRRPVPARDDRRRHPRPAALSRRARRHGDALHGRRRPRGGAQFPRLGRHRPQGGVAALDADRDHDRAMPRYAAYAGGMAGGLGNPLGARALYLYRGEQGHLFPPARDQRAGDDRHGGVERLHPPVQPRHHRPLQPRPGRNAGGGVAGAGAGGGVAGAGAGGGRRRSRARRWARRSRTVRMDPAPMEGIIRTRAPITTADPITTAGRRGPRGRGQGRRGRTAGSISRNGNSWRAAMVS